jgi:hypothetical protein
MKYLILFFILYTQTTFGQSKEYESFYRGDLGIQYFIKPLEYQNSNNSLEIDFVYLQKNLRAKEAITNFSLFTDEKVLSVDFGGDVYEVNQLFIEQIEEKIHARYTTTITIATLKRLVNDTLSIKINDISYNPSKKTMKTLDEISKQLISKIRN